MTIGKLKEMYPSGYDDAIIKIKVIRYVENENYEKDGERLKKEEIILPAEFVLTADDKSSVTLWAIE